MSIISNIILGAIGSILATIILYMCSILYKVGYKEDFKFNLNVARTATYQIQNQHRFPEDYGLVINQIDVIHRCAFNMYRDLYPLALSFRRKEKKMIMTLLSDIIAVCEISKYTTVGYSGESEKEARLEKIHKYFYKYYELDEVNCSTVIVQLDILDNIINGKSIRRSMEDAFGCLVDKIAISDLAIDGFIHINSFRKKNDVGIRKRSYSKIEFEKLLLKQFEKTKAIL